MKLHLNTPMAKRKPLNISQMIALGFLAVILIGTLLLLMPISSRSGESCGIKTALFTATSSTCVTGLILKDTFVQWSGLGQFIIITLIEIGGLGFMSFASCLIILLKKKISLNQKAAIATSLGSDDMASVVRIQKRAIKYSISAQFIGAVILSVRFAFDTDILTGLKLGFFHSISAFCNAGFDILGFMKEGASVSLYGTDAVVVFTLSFLIIFGGLGFICWDEIFSKKSPKKWSVYTKLVLITSLCLIIFGTVMFCITEWNNPLSFGNMRFGDKLKASFFQAVTTRTAGFAGIDQGALSEGGKAISIFLMLIGGSSGSTAGGLKTVTFIVLVLFLYTKLRGKEHIHIFYRSIPFSQVLNALTVFGVMITLAFFGGAFICAANGGISFTNALFESVSALATVGLTTGITPHLGTASQILLIIYMYFGRVGILTVSLGFLQTTYSSKHYKYAETALMIG